MDSPYCISNDAFDGATAFTLDVVATKAGAVVFHCSEYGVLRCIDRLIGGIEFR